MPVKSNIYYLLANTGFWPFLEIVSRRAKSHFNLLERRPTVRE